MTPAKELPMVMEKSVDEIKEIIDLVTATNLPEAVKVFVIGCINLATWLPKGLMEHRITITNLKRLIFGKGDKKQKNNHQPKTPDENPKPKNNKSGDNTTDDTNDNKKLKGHGRLAHSVYENANEHHIELDGLKSGELCPLQCGGKLYQLAPGIIVNIKGQNLGLVNKYWLEKLRCGLCGEIFTAQKPDNVSKDKYQPSFKAMLALQKYHMAMPFHRQAHFQSLLGFPLPSSTQWQLMEELGSCVLSIFPFIEKMAANGHLVQNDDTFLRIVDVIRHNRQNPDEKRTGMFTTGILSHNGAYKIALFYNSKRHSGENMERLLDKRDRHQGTVIQMCDALSHNRPANHQTIECHCLSHGFRKFEELEPFYPESCQTIMAYLAIPFEIDRQSKALVHDEHQRLSYHQQHSQTAMTKAKAYMEELLSSKQVEPNESLGKAINYMLKHWEKLTRFLQVPGALIHNNDTERALKIAIRGRNTWLFYKTEYGAMIGGIITSIIHTCELNGINPYDYLIALQDYKDRIVKEPAAWLPWNYQQTKLSLDVNKAA
tara:strand:+ start:112 stop:1746 length:1635 start_codon:yes stop_codon:yes gene_type:complete